MEPKTNTTSTNPGNAVAQLAEAWARLFRWKPQEPAKSEPDNADEAIRSHPPLTVDELEDWQVND